MNTPTDTAPCTLAPHGHPSFPAVTSSVTCPASSPTMTCTLCPWTTSLALPASPRTPHGWWILPHGALHQHLFLLQKSKTTPELLPNGHLTNSFPVGTHRDTNRIPQSRSQTPPHIPLQEPPPSSGHRTDPRMACASTSCPCARGNVSVPVQVCQRVLEYLGYGTSTSGARTGSAGNGTGVTPLEPGTATRADGELCTAQTPLPGGIPAQIPPNSHWKFTPVCANTEKSQSLQVNKHSKNPLCFDNLALTIPACTGSQAIPTKSCLKQGFMPFKVSFPCAIHRNNYKNLCIWGHFKADGNAQAGLSCSRGSTLVMATGSSGRRIPTGDKRVPQVCL